MKKIIAILAIGLIFAVPTKSHATPTTNIDVVMTIQSLDITIFGSTFVVVGAALGDSRVSPRITVRNNGSTNEDYLIRVTSASGGWTLVTSTPGANEYRLSALFHQFDALPSTGTYEFQANDVLSGSYQTASNSVFFNEGETHTTANIKGFNVPVFNGDFSNERNVFFRFDAPSSNTTDTAATSHISLSAALTP